MANGRKLQLTPRSRVVAPHATSCFKKAVFGRSKRPFGRPSASPHGAGTRPYRPSQALEIVSGRISICTNRPQVLGVPWEPVVAVGRPPRRFLLADHLKRYSKYEEFSATVSMRLRAWCVVAQIELAQRELGTYSRRHLSATVAPLLRGAGRTPCIGLAP